jgi:hypothetical protein
MTNCELFEKYTTLCKDHAWEFPEDHELRLQLHSSFCTLLVSAENILSLEEIIGEDGDEYETIQ